MQFKKVIHISTKEKERKKEAKKERKRKVTTTNNCQLFSGRHIEISPNYPNPKTQKRDSLRTWRR